MNIRIYSCVAASWLALLTQPVSAECMVVNCISSEMQTSKNTFAVSARSAGLVFLNEASSNLQSIAARACLNHGFSHMVLLGAGSEVGAQPSGWIGGMGFGRLNYRPVATASATVRCFRPGENPDALDAQQVLNAEGE